MIEALGDHRDRDPVGDEQRSVGVAQVVEPDVRHIAAQHDAVEQLTQRFRVEEPSGAAAEHPIVGPVWETVKTQPVAPPVELGGCCGIDVDAIPAGAGLHVELDGSPGKALCGPAPEI